MRIRLLHDLGTDQTGAVIEKDDRHATWLIAQGYAEAVKTAPVKKAKE